MKDKDLEQNLCCAICQETFSNPVINEHGQSYDEKCITNIKKDPITKKDFSIEKIIPNLLLMRISQNYTQKKFSLDGNSYIPTDFICPITGKLMQSPVVVVKDTQFPASATFSKKKILLRRGESCDVTALNGITVQIYENFVVKSLIQSYVNLIFKEEISNSKQEEEGIPIMQKLFSNDFVQQQREVFEKYSREVGEKYGLLNAQDAEEILKYMASIETPERNNITCVSLLNLINNKITDFGTNYKSATSHSYTKALQEVKKNVIDSINHSHPKIKNAINDELQKTETSKSEAQRNKVKDIVRLITCGIWLPFQKVLSCADNGGQGCGDSRACNPLRTIKELNNDIKKQNAIIKSADEAVIPLKMMK